MPYCTYVDVERIIDTSLESADITALIILADAEINQRDIRGNADIKKQISMYFTAALCSAQDPESRGVGEFRETYRTAPDYRDQAEQLIRSTRKPGCKRG